MILFELCRQLTGMLSHKGPSFKQAHAQSTKADTFLMTLDYYGEHTHHVPGLPVPGGKQYNKSFCERKQTFHNSHFLVFILVAKVIKIYARIHIFFPVSHIVSSQFN